MPQYSAFTRYGHLRYSAKPSTPELIYKAIIRNWGGQFSTAIGSRSEAWVYATAFAVARAAASGEHCGNQFDPLTTVDMLPVQEAKYGINPGTKDSIRDRQRALAAKRLLPAGAAYLPVSNALAALLGADFLDYRITADSEVVVFPSDPATGPANWIHTKAAPKIVRLTSAVSITGTPRSVSYAPIDVRLVSTIQTGDVVVVSANNDGLAEKVTVTGYSANSFTATFTKAHDPGDICTTGFFPYWLSTKKHSLIVVTPTCAIDREKRRKIHALMQQVATGVSTWDIAPSADGVHTDRFLPGDAVLGVPGYAYDEAVTFP